MTVKSTVHTSISTAPLPLLTIFVWFIQLCELTGIVKRDNKRDLILNYRNLLFQR
jgi:hypothetical protein